MKVALFLLSLSVMAIVSYAADESSCTPHNEPCDEPQECCSELCNYGFCADPPKAGDPCYQDCPPGQRCIYRQVTCITAPCYPIPSCVRRDY